MATYITVDNGDAALVERARQLQRANRQAELQRQRDAALETRAALEQTSAVLEGPNGGLPDTEVVRRPAAQRRGGKLLPFAISWKGVFSGGSDATAVTLLRTVEVLGSGTRYDLITSTHTGGRHLTPSPIRFASNSSSVASAEIARMERWATNVVTCETSSSPDSCVLPSYSLPTQFASQWLTEARRYIGEPYIPVLPAPEVSLPVGDVTYTPTAIATVGADGTTYLVFTLPKEPRSLTPMTYQAFKDAGFPEDTLVIGNSVSMRYSYVYEPYYGLTTWMYSPQSAQRYIFIKSKGASMESKIVTRPQSQSLGDFLYANLYAEDPSKEARQQGYLGEYRISNGTAKFLQLNNGDGTYTGFPYGYLQDYKDGTDIPALTGGAVFEDYTYRLQPYSSTAELVAQLEAMQVVGSGPTPLSKVKIPTTQAVFARAKAQLGDDPGEQVTPYLYLAVGQ